MRSLRPGSGPAAKGVEEPMFYSYAYPSPSGFRDQAVQPSAAYFDETLGEFLLPYAAALRSEAPADTLMQFLQSTYEVAAETGRWDRAALEVPSGRPGVARLVPA